MKIGLISDSHNFPNLALMKISAFHKQAGHNVDFYNSENIKEYSEIFASKTFTWSGDFEGVPEWSVKGGTGYQSTTSLPDFIEHLCPDYSLYDLDYSLGFLTRGCPRKCNFCFVPWKEGSIQEHAEIEEFLRHKKVVLMDNNVLASEHGIKQIEKLIKLKVKVDFNQGLDARLIDRPMAKLLSKVKWNPSVRLACDSKANMDSLFNAVKWLRYYNTTPSRYFVYMLVKDIESALERAMFMKTLNLDPFAQGLRTIEKPEPDKPIKDFCRWVNHKGVFKSTPWEDYQK
jgi:hypothetical protein